MSRHPLYDRVVAGDATTFTAALVVAAELEHLTDDGIGLLCNRIDGDGSTDADVLVTGALMHWSSKALACARPGDMASIVGRAEQVEAGPGQVRPLLRVHNPTRLEIWRRVAHGPITTAAAIGDATA